MDRPYYIEDGITLYHAECLAVLKAHHPQSVDAIVTDPPYHLTTGKKGGRGVASLNLKSPAGRSRVTTGFMGKAWDGGNVAFQTATWEVMLRIAKPGAYLVAFGGLRTYHRLTCAIEDAGWEIRDCLMWIFGSGFPKSLNVSKAIDKLAGAKREVVRTGKPVKRMIPGADQDKTGSWIKDSGREFVPTYTAPATDDAKQWAGWGTALKPSFEPILLARKPLEGTVAQNVLKWGTGAMNIDGCRVSVNPDVDDMLRTVKRKTRISETWEKGSGFKNETNTRTGVPSTGRWPANVLHDGSDEAIAAFPDAPGQIAPYSNQTESRKNQNCYSTMRRGRGAEPSAENANDGLVGFKMKPGARRLDTGSAARFFYSAKASRADRGHEEWDALPLFDEPAGHFRNTHPTVKPLALMRYLLTLVSREGAMVLDPFLGSGTTAVAAKQLGRRCVGIEQEEVSCQIAVRRIKSARLL